MEALLSAFPSFPSLTIMVTFGLSESLVRITAGNADLTYAVFQLIEWAIADGRLADLILAARNANPGNSRLRRFAETLALAPQSRALESIYTPGKALADVDDWKTKMSLAELAVCRIEIGGAPQGTGFLVHSRLVMTARHVLGPIWRKSAPVDSLICRFDYKILKTDPIPVNSGVKYCLADDWLVDESPTTRGGLDFALLALKEPAGDLAINNQMGAPKRGWLPIAAHDLTEKEHLFIIQHPNAEPMKLGVGKVGTISATQDHFCHDVDTLPGSSGSPCFCMDWNLIGIHQHGSGYSSECLANGAINIAAIMSRDAAKRAIE